MRWERWGSCWHGWEAHEVGQWGSGVCRAIAGSGTVAARGSAVANKGSWAAYFVLGVDVGPGLEQGPQHLHIRVVPSSIVERREPLLHSHTGNAQSSQAPPHRPRPHSAAAGGAWRQSGSGEWCGAVGGLVVWRDGMGRGGVWCGMAWGAAACVDGMWLGVVWLGMVCRLW